MVGRDAAKDALWWRILGWSFAAGALLDLPFGIGILAARQRLAPLFQLTLPDGMRQVYLDLNGMFLLALGAIYLLVAREPRRLAPVAAVATLLRFGGFALFYGDVLSGRAERFFLVIGGIEGVLGLVHMFLLHMAAGSLVTAIWKREHLA